MAQEDLMQEVCRLQTEITRLEKEKKDRELDEPIGTIAGCLTILFVAFLGGVFWGIDVLFLKNSLRSLIQTYSTESSGNGIIVAILGTVTFFIIAIFMFIMTNNFFRQEEAVSDNFIDSNDN